MDSEQDETDTPRKSQWDEASRLRKAILVAVALAFSMTLLHFAGQGAVVIGSV